MPSTDQLAHITVVDGDGATTTQNDDGSTTTDWPDGTQRVDYADGSVMVLFTDNAVLNIATDGTRTLNDVNGVALDPTTGVPLAPAPPVDAPPSIGPDTLLHLMEGDESIKDLTAAKGYFDALKGALEGDIDPAEWVVEWIKMVLQVVKAVETEERGCYVRGWCYGVLYGAQDMGTPPEPSFSGSLQGADQDTLDREYWDKGVAASTEQLADGTKGVGLRNRALLRIAHNGGDVAKTVREMYVTACEHNDDSALAKAYGDILGWPTPVGA